MILRIHKRKTGVVSGLSFFHIDTMDILPHFPEKCKHFYISAQIFRTLHNLRQDISEKIRDYFFRERRIARGKPAFAADMPCRLPRRFRLP